MSGLSSAVCNETGGLEAFWLGYLLGYIFVCCTSTSFHKTTREEGEGDLHIDMAVRQYLCVCEDMPVMRFAASDQIRAHAI